MAKNKAEAPAEAVEEKPVKVKEPVNPQVPAAYKTEKGTYKPGHDAKHASDVAGRILAGEDESEALRELGSDNLRTKALKQVETARSKFATAGTEGTVKIDDVEYEARKVRGGPVRFDGDDGWESVNDGPVFDSFLSTKDAEKAKAEAEKAGQAE